MPVVSFHCQLCKAPKTNNAHMSDVPRLHRMVHYSNSPNYMGIQIKMASNLIIKNCNYYLANY